VCRILFGSSQLTCTKANHVVGEVQREPRNVLDAIVIVALTLAAHFDRHFAEQHQDDRDVVRRQVPRHVDVAPEHPEIRAHGIDVENVAQLAAADQLADFPHRRAVLEGVPRHQREIALARHPNEHLGLLA